MSRAVSRRIANKEVTHTGRAAVPHWGLKKSSVVTKKSRGLNKYSVLLHYLPSISRHLHGLQDHEQQRYGDDHRFYAMIFRLRSDWGFLRAIKTDMSVCVRRVPAPVEHKFNDSRLCPGGFALR